jgi:hypothetical protein
MKNKSEKKKHGNDLLELVYDVLGKNFVLNEDVEEVHRG